MIDEALSDYYAWSLKQREHSDLQKDGRTENVVREMQL